MPFAKTDENERLFLTDPVKNAPFLAEIAKDPMGAVCYYYHGFADTMVAAPNTFANVPKHYATGGANGAAKDSVLLRKDMKINELFAIGDKVEFNGDGVLRTVTGIEGQVLKFTPAFPPLPCRIRTT